MTAPSTNDVSLYSEGGVEKPTHTTPHNQVIVAAIPDPSPDVMTNYLQLRRERDCSWEDVASLVETGDPALADYLRRNGAAFEKAQDDTAVTGLAPVLTERAINPLTTPDERQAFADGTESTGPSQDAGAHAADTSTAKGGNGSTGK